MLLYVVNFTGYCLIRRTLPFKPFFFLLLQGHDIYGFDLDLLLHRINACKVSAMILIVNRLDDEFL